MSSGNRRVFLGVVMLAAACAAGAAAPAAALPRYAARYAQGCNLCHLNPTGGGLRSLYASQYLVPAELVMYRPNEAQMAKINPQIGENVTLGADLRTLFTASPDGPGAEGFFQMQSSFYLGLQFDDRWSACLDRGQSGSFEAFGLGYVLPADGYVKVGRFAPAFGLRLEDHTAAVRQELGLAPPRHTDTGLEAGVYPGPIAAQVSLLNGAPGSSRDTDRRLAVTGRAAVRARAGPLLLAAGGSVRRNHEPAGRRVTGGPFGSVVWGPLTWLGECDWSRIDSTGAGRATAWVATQELTCQLRRGLDARATFSFHDPDTARRGGAQARYGLGCDAHVTPFFGLQAMVNVYDRRRGPDFTGRDDTETVVMAHFLY